MPCDPDNFWSSFTNGTHGVPVTKTENSLEAFRAACRETAAGAEIGLSRTRCCEYKGVLSEVLARVTSRAVEGPRGPDVLHRVKVERAWLTLGEVVELELPRNLACAGCGGGGCDACGRSGAITLRSKDEPAEVVEVTLPIRGSDDLPDSRGITLRIPEQGGLPEPGSELPRGLLLLTVVPSQEADPSVKRLHGLTPRAPASIADSDEKPLGLAESPLPRRMSPALLIVAVAVVLWILLLIWLRLSGQG